jgi:dipeptidyl aminopeptidase/acylaminoacyl peptidase
MASRTVTALWRASALLLVLCGSAGAAQVEPIPLVEWVAAGLVSAMKISPDGKRVASVGSTNTRAVIVTELDTSRTTVVARTERDNRYLFGSWPVAVNWVGNDLLAVDYSGKESVSVDLSGKRIATLGERFIRRMVEKGESSDWVLAYRDLADGDIDAVNARTGERRKYRISLPGKLMHWAFDPAGELRAVTMMDTAFWAEKTKVSNWYRAHEQAPWELLEEGPVTGEHWTPLRVLSEPDSLAVLSRHERDTYAVFRYDTKLRKHVELMAGHPTEDILAVSGLEQESLDMVVTAGMKTQVTWLEPRWARLQAAVDAALPGRVNLLQGEPGGRLLVTSYGDVDPGRWFVLDTKTSKLRELGEMRPLIDPDRMRPMEIIRYPARDGLIIPAYVTRPRQEVDQPAPMVVLIHGGPHERDRWAWNQEVQLLANRGYVVFQPQFRGSSGFGRRFEEAGYGQWGRAMQDDISDGVQHLVAQKVADPARICIYGASYGGYAALWGAIQTPQLYKCGISFAGVSDLNDMLSHSIFDDSNPASRELQRARIGDPSRARQSLDEVSPLRHAARVQVPLLITHGEEDTRVLPSQSKRMVKALQAAGKPVEWLSYEQEGHGFYWLANQVKHYEAVLAFLQRHIGSLPPASGAEVKQPAATPR